MWLVGGERRRSGVKWWNRSTKQNRLGTKKATAAVTGGEVEDRNRPSETAAPKGAALPPTNNRGDLGKAGAAGNVISTQQPLFKQRK